jgi:hypothetical protein
MPTPGDYARALSEFHAADQELKRLVAQLRSFTERLSQFPGETCFVDIDNEVQPPLDQLIPGARWYAAEFPSPETIQLALRRRHEARAACSRIRDHLSEHQLRGAPPIPQ